MAMNKKNSVENKKRCAWVSQDPLYIQYHDQEWGAPCYDEQRLFEMLCLEGAQAGLSWITILKKREHYQQLFDQFDAYKIARYGESKINALLTDQRIIRNRLKINAFIANAKAYLEIKKNDSFSNFIWQFVEHKPIVNHWYTHEEIPVKTAQSAAMSKVLKQQGFKFVGPTICYAYMQAVGMVNDHVVDCFKYKACRD